MEIKDNSDKVQMALKEFLVKIYPYTWVYEYGDGIIYEVSFETSDLMHLLSLNHLNKYVMMKNKKIKGLGSICYEDLKKKKITDEKIAKTKKKRLIQRKIHNFNKLKNLLDDIKTQHFYFNKDQVPSRISAEYMLYNSLSNIHCHFGVTETRKKKGRVPKSYSPITWFIEEDRPDMYIKGQEEAVLKSIIKINNDTGDVIFNKNNVDVTVELAEEAI